MKERDIRPENLLMKVLELHEEDVKQLMTQKNKFVEVSCPCCESNKNIHEYEKEGFDFVKCCKCNTVYITPRPTVDMLSNFYATSESMKFWNDILFPETELYRKNNLFEERANKVLSLCNKYINNFNKIVDVGAGYGTFCEVMKEKNIFKEVIAVEPSIGLAETCTKRGINTINLPIEKVNLENVSVITNFEVIEHLFNPRDFVNSCADILPKDGLLVITTPNIEGFELNMLKTLSPNIGGPDHLNYFTPKSLCILLENCGFEVLEISTPGKLDAELVRKEILRGNLDLGKENFIYHILVDNWEYVKDSFQMFLSENNLSSHMWAVAKKI